VYHPVRRQVPSRTLRTVSATLLAALLAAGCGTQSGGGGDADRRPTARESSGEPGRTPTASPSPPRKPTASDGTRYAACADGTCEVAVSRPVDIAVDGGTLEVTEVKAGDKVEFELTPASGAGSSGTLKGCGTVLQVYPGGGGARSSVCEEGEIPDAPEPVPGIFQMQMAGWDDDHAAVLRLVS
jgi:hypothetical protein